MKPGDRVLVFSERCSFRGMRGEVVEGPGLWVRLDGEECSMAFSESEVMREEESSPHLAGAE